MLELLPTSIHMCVGQGICVLSKPDLPVITEDNVPMEDINNNHNFDDRTGCCHGHLELREAAILLPNETKHSPAFHNTQQMSFFQKKLQPSSTHDMCGMGKDGNRTHGSPSLRPDS